MFHSFTFMHNLLISNVLKGETYTHQGFTFAFIVSLLRFNVSFPNLGARDLKPWCKSD